MPLLPLDAAFLLECNEPYMVGLRASFRSIASFPDTCVLVDADRNSVFLPAHSVQLPSKLKTRLYKIMVRFMSSTFLMRTRAGKAAAAASTSPAADVDNVASASTMRRSLNLSSSISTRRRRHHSICGQPHVVTLPIGVDAERDDVALFAPLKALRDGFLGCFAQLLYRYRLFWQRQQASFDAVGFLSHCKDADRAFLEALVRSHAFASFLRVRNDAAEHELAACEFEALVLDALATKWTQLDAVEGVSLVGSLYVARGRSKLKKRWVVLRDAKLSIYKSKRSQKKVKDQVTLVPGHYYVSTLSEAVPSSASGSFTSASGNVTSAAAMHLQRFVLVLHVLGEPELLLKAETHSFRKQWQAALQARSLTKELKAAWLAALLERQHQQRRRSKHHSRPKPQPPPPLDLQQ